MSTSRDQLNRLLALVPYLQARGEIPVEDAAREFGVSPATIRRDIGVLMFCGLPGLGMGDLIDVDFEALEGEDVIRLSNADYLTRPLRLDSTEAAALVVGLRALLAGRSGSEREVVERTLAKVEHAAGEAARVAAQVELRPQEDDRVQETRRRLEDALAERRQVRIRHRSPVRDELTTRVVDPIAVSGAEGHTYLDAWCHQAEDRRLFRLDRLEEVEVLDGQVSARADTEPLDLSQGAFRPPPDALRARLVLSGTARWVADYFPVEALEEGPEGLEVTLRVDDPTWLVRLMLRLGDGARLLEPAELAERVRHTARQALAAYT